MVIAPINNPLRSPTTSPTGIPTIAVPPNPPSIESVNSLALEVLDENSIPSIASIMYPNAQTALIIAPKRNPKLLIRYSEFQNIRTAVISELEEVVMSVISDIIPA
jgi:hypothetical protein